MKFITLNNEVESIIKIFENKRNGRKDWITSQKYYEGQGIYANDNSKSDTDLKNLFYAGEKKPHIWWVEYEGRLNLALQTYIKIEG